MLPEDFDYTKAQISTVTKFSKDSWLTSWDTAEHMPEGYIPIEGSVITDALIKYGNLSLYITEPSGRELEARFSDWE
jgi:hypothetical protein